MEYKAVAVGREHERDVERGRVFQALLHAVTDAVGVVLGLDQGQRDVRLEVQDVVGALGLAAADQLAAYDDPALGEADFLTDLQHLIPARLAQGRGDELGADVAFTEGSLVHEVGFTERATHCNKSYGAAPASHYGTQLFAVPGGCSKILDRIDEYSPLRIVDCVS